MNATTIRGRACRAHGGTRPWVPRLSLLSRALPGRSRSSELTKRNNFDEEHG
jgi:hypothetical protein